MICCKSHLLVVFKGTLNMMMTTFNYKNMKHYDYRGLRLNKGWLYHRWYDLAGQHYRAGNATEFLICISNAARVYYTYLR